MNDDLKDQMLGLAFILISIIILSLSIIELMKKEIKVKATYNTARCIEYDKGILDGRIEFVDLNPHWVSKSILPKCKKWEKN